MSRYGFDSLSLRGMVFVLCTVSLMAAGTFHADAAAPEQKTITISPFLSEVQIQPADASKNITISVANTTSERQSFDVSAVDFGSLNDTGGLAFDGGDVKAFTRKYGLAHWLRLSTDHLNLDAGKSTSLTATIVNDETLGPGGHYASIILTVAGQGSADDTDAVTVQQKISSLVFATKQGGEVYDMHLAGLQQEHSWLHVPELFTLTFKNNGNVHVVPRGTLKVIAPNGKVVGQGIVNEASAYILPETSRQMAVQTDMLGSSWLPGKYQVTVDYRYDGHPGFASKTMYFTYLNPVGILVLILGLGVFAYVGYRQTNARNLTRPFRRFIRK